MILSNVPTTSDTFSAALAIPGCSASRSMPGGRRTGAVAFVDSLSPPSFVGIRLILAKVNAQDVILCERCGAICRSRVAFICEGASQIIRASGTALTQPQIIRDILAAGLVDRDDRIEKADLLDHSRNQRHFESDHRLVGRLVNKECCSGGSSIVGMHVFEQLFAHVEKTLPRIAPRKPIVGMKILDEIDAVIFQPLGIQVIEAGYHMRTVMASIIDDEIEWPEFLYHALQEFRISLASDANPDSIGRRIELDTFRSDVDADDERFGVRKI